MVLIAVAGGTGLAGRAVVEEVVARGQQVRSLSRRPPSAEARVAGAEYVHGDFRTGQGVAAGLVGADALIETLDARQGAGLRALPVTSVAALKAAADAGVRRCVLLTIVRAGECSMGYYQAQAARALSYEHSGLPTSVVYATQFHNLVAGIFSAGAKVGVIPAFHGVSFQPIATADVARVLVGEALVEGPGHRAVPAGGPAVLTMRELAQEWRFVTGSKARVTTMPLPGSFGTFLRLGKNLVPEHAVGQISFGQWLRANGQGS
ncbi:SDR family oxidoreductase [Arthrobacter sp. HLT1-20]